MENLHASILYQNQLFGEGLESILHKENVKVSNYPVTSVDLIAPLNSRLLLIETNWPFVNIEKILKNENIYNGEKCRIILLPNIVNKNLVKLVKEGKVNGIVMKRGSAEELFFAIKQVMDGKKYFCSTVTNLLMKNNDGATCLKVSNREKQILSLLAEMKTTAEIASELSISPSTVKTHRRNLMHRFKAKNILCLLKLACRENLLNEEVNYCCCCYKQIIGN